MDSDDQDRAGIDDTVHARAKLWELIKDLKFAMLTTRHPNGHLHSRPMTTQNRGSDEDDVLWFLTSRRGEVVGDIATERQVNVAYASPDDDTYVTVSGEAQVVEDPEQVKALWNAANQAWFPGGPTDPDIALLRVAIEHASYWDVKENKLVQLLHMATAAVSGKPPVKMGERADVRMR